MKKLLMALLGIALVISMAGVASAADVEIKYDSTKPNVAPTGKMDVKLNLVQTYTVTIPNTVNLVFGEQVVIDDGLKVTDMVIPSTHELFITATSANKWFVVDSSNNKISYSMKVTKGLETPVTCRPNAQDTNKDTYEIYTAHMRQVDPDPATLTFELLSTDVVMGEYSDSVTFTVDVRAKATSTTTT
ncbi:MAG: hypothetical protein IJA20_06530 [Methanocorpusculum sp.]|nr:hypothetical protein [Methanocorpusculum sp.]